MPHTPTATSSETIRILSKGVGKWKVMLRLPMDQVRGRKALFKKISLVKQQLAQMLELPAKLLEFGDIKEKKQEGDYLTVKLDVAKKQAESGPLMIHILPATSDYGVEFPDMVATLDLYVFDAFDSLVSEDKIHNLIKKHQIPPEMVKWNDIRQSIEQLVDTQTPIHGLEIARGYFPEPGKDAEIQFPSSGNLSIDEVVQNIDYRRVRRGDFILHKINPQRGRKEGVNVRGEPIPSPMGKNIRIKAGRGTIIDLSDTKISSQIDGLMVVEYAEEQPENHDNSGDEKKAPIPTIHVKVNPLRLIDGDEQLDLCTNSSVEVLGNLKPGSKIISASEIIIKGDVEEGTSLESKEDIHIFGTTEKAALTSHKGVYLTGNASETEITAKEAVTVDGAAVDTTITGGEVNAMELHGGGVIAKERVTIGKIAAGKDGRIPDIKVGADDFHRNRVQENERFIDFGQSNLNEMRKIFGESMVEQVNRVNLKSMFLRHLKDLRLTSRTSYQKDQARSVMRLLDSTSSIRELLNEKVKENNELSELIQKALSALKELVILEGNSSPINVKLGSHIVKVPAADGGRKFSQEGENEIAEEDATYGRK
jgi:hypothetical protein